MPQMCPWCFQLLTVSYMCNTFIDNCYESVLSSILISLYDWICYSFQLAYIIIFLVLKWKMDVFPWHLAPFHLISSWQSWYKFQLYTFGKLLKICIWIWICLVSHTFAQSKVHSVFIPPTPQKTDDRPKTWALTVGIGQPCFLLARWCSWESC